MTRKFLPYWMTPEIMKAAAVMAAMLFVVSYLVDLTLMRLDVSPSSTILNDIAIAMIATGVMLFYLFVTHFSSREGTHEPHCRAQFPFKPSAPRVSFGRRSPRS